MAITYDNSSTYTYVNTSGNSTSYTMGSGRGGILIVSTSFNVTAATYGGVSMTNYLSYEPSIHDGNQQQINVYVLYNPPTGSNTLDITTNGSLGVIAIVSYIGVSTIEGYNTAFSHNLLNNIQVSNLDVSNTSTADNCWNVLLCSGGGNFPVSFVIGGGAGVVRQSSSFIFGDAEHGIYDSNGPKTPAGTVTLTSTWASGSGFISNVIITLAPSQEFVPQMTII